MKAQPKVSTKDQVGNEDVDKRLNDPDFNIDEWLESKNKSLAESLGDQYQKRIKK